MRMSVDKDDPGYENWCKFRPKTIKVFLDDVNITDRCLTADTEEGFVMLERQTPDGRPMVVNSNVMYEHRQGKVVII